MSALATAPKTYTPDSAGRQMYALTFASSVAHLFFEDGDLCCGMMGDRAKLVAQLWNDGLISKLIDRCLLAPTKPCKVGYPFALKLDSTPTVSFSYEWCGEMWKAAALCVIDLMVELAGNDLTLRFPNPWNVQFSGARPVYVNAGTIGVLNPEAFARAISRLVRCFLYPLHFCRKGQGRLARILLRDAIYGICPDDFLELAELERKHEAYVSDSTPERMLALLREEVEEVVIPDPETAWSEYHRDWPLKPCDRWGHSLWAVHRVFKDLHPGSVLDLAGNMGWYARLAAVEGAEAISADIDETRVNRLYRRLRHENARVLPLVLDLNDPSPGYGVNNRWFPPATERLQSDLVLALAVTHHLVLAEFRLGFDQVVRSLASFTRRALLVEFVPFESDGSLYDTNPYYRDSRPDAVGWYDMDHFVRVLRREFRRVSALPSPPKSRRLLLCER
jgi:hypothetical protein